MVSSSTIFNIDGSAKFSEICLEVFRFQAEHCRVYAEFVNHLGVDPAAISEISDIPFLPVSFFKNKVITTGGGHEDVVFTSSGTTGVIQSRHFVTDVSMYVESYQKGFRLFYGDPADYVILALLPSYQERTGSSLIYMIDDLIRQTGNSLSNYVLHEPELLAAQLSKFALQREKVILIGVTYALLDFAEKFRIHFPELIVMETGGMKGRRKEIIRQEVHEQLCNAFSVPRIHSEYGMTELLSQAYSQGEGLFSCPPWMSVFARDMYDPMSVCSTGKTGGLNVIDLANLNSCSFIATQDLGRVYADGSFEVLGRFDNSDIRGCNLMVQQE